MRLPSLLTLLLLPLFAPAAELPYKVGAAKVDITPDHPIRLNGYGFRRDESEGTYQKVYARALAIDDGSKTPAVLLTIDVLGMPADLYDQLAKRLKKKLDLPADRLAVAATHTHTGPMLAGSNPTIFGVPIPKEHLANIDKYTPVFLDKLEEAAAAAVKAMRPATLERGVGQVGFAGNRRKGGGPSDHDLPVLFAKDAKGKVIAVYTTYACHCTTLSINKIGGDWAGFAAEGIEGQYEGAVGLVGIGCGADQNPKAVGKEELAQQYGKEIAAEVKRLAGQYLSPVSGKLTATTKALDLPLADLPDRAGWEERAKRKDAIGHHARVQLARLDAGEKLMMGITYPVQTWAFGDTLAMVHLPGEVVVDYGLRLKRDEDGGRLWVTAYANNAPCYIPSERVLKEGGYEGGDAMIYYDVPVPFAPGLEDKIVDEVARQLGKPFAARYDPTKTNNTRPLSPQRSHAAIRTRQGVTADLVVAEPLVQDPVAIAFGADGTLWVTEMADYPTGVTPNKFDAGGRIVRLTDTDGDGRPDKRTVFLSDVPLPTGVLPWRKGVLVCAAPDILFAEDTDGDGKADKTEKLYSGFGVGNFQGRVNSLAYGLDGWVYGSCGLFGGTITCGKTGKKVQLGDRDFRIKPDTGELEPAAGRTQQGRVRSDGGDWFGCDNSDLLRHYPLPDSALSRNPHATYPTNSRSIAPGPVFPAKTDAQRFALSGPAGTVTAACGLGLYRDELLGDDFRGDAFTCEPVNLLVTRRKLTPDGGTFTASRAKDEASSEFLASTDGWFRPVQAVTGPDGGLWVVDMYRFLIEHPRWLPPVDLPKIDVRAGSGLGRLYRVRPADKPVRKWEDLTKLDTAGLVAALDSPNGWQRDAAMMQLVWSGDPKAAEFLRKPAKSGKLAVVRMQALCTLGLVSGSTDDFTDALSDADAGVRRHAIRLLAPHLNADPKLAASVAARAKDDDPAVRIEVAIALGGWREAAAGEALAKLAHRDRDNPYLLAAVASSWTSTNLPPFATTLLKEGGEAGPPAAVVRPLLATAASLDDGAALPRVLTVVLPKKTERYADWQLAAAAGTLDAFSRQGTGWAKLPAQVKAAVEPVLQYARKRVEGDKATEADLLAALPLLARDPDTRADDIKRLSGLLAATKPATVQTEAVAALARTSDASAASALITAWGGASPALRGRILDALLGRAGWHGELMTAVEKGTIPAGQIDAARRGRLTTSSEVKDRAVKAFAGGPTADRKKVIDEYAKVADTKGDATKGKAVFAKVCATCHQLDGAGHAVGPDLAMVANRTPAYLLGELLDPNRNLDSRYAEYTVNTTDGRTVVGLLASETAAAVTLRAAEGKEEVIPRAGIDTFKGGVKSLMPEGLEKDVPPAAMADLLAYLLASDPPPKKMPGNTPAEVKPTDGRLTLTAATARVYGNQIVFEPDFGNLGYWNGDNDQAAWVVILEKTIEFDVFLDYACATDSTGGRWALSGGEPELRGVVAGTGGWNTYKLVKAGTLTLPAGKGKVVVRPDAPLKGVALFDLRTVYLVPKGERPKADTPTKSPAEQIAALVAGLPAEFSEAEGKVIPKVWEVAIAAGKADDAATVREVLKVSLPKDGEKLRQWQAVVVGGGIVNGISLGGKWPTKRIAEVIGKDEALAKRWAAAVAASHAMADDPKVSDGTRYDALRLAALDDWKKAEPTLTKHLGKAANAELQMGAVSGLADADHPDAAELLAKGLPDFTDGNRALAIGGLVRTAERATALLDAVEKGTAKAEWVGKPHREALAKLSDAVKARAEKVLK